MFALIIIISVDKAINRYLFIINYHQHCILGEMNLLITIKDLIHVSYLMMSPKS